MQVYLPFKPTKNQAFTLEFTIGNGGFVPSSIAKSVISKDGANYVDTTNTPTYSTTPTKSGFGTLALTAAEMDADVIKIGIADDAGFNGSHYTGITIFTTGYTADGDNLGASAGGGGGATINLAMSAGTMTTIVQVIAKGFSLSKVALDESGYNYFGLVNRAGIWQIIRETTDLLTTDFSARNPSQQTFTDAWTNRATLTYVPERDI